MQMRHHCMESRGIQKYGTVTIVSALREMLLEKPEARRSSCRLSIQQSITQLYYEQNKTYA